jgi:hypothetical protein
MVMNVFVFRRKMNKVRLILEMRRMMMTTTKKEMNTKMKKKMEILVQKHW